MNKQGEHGIPYCDYTWNPVTGCLHGCTYCFAERIAKRFNGTKAFPDGFTPTFHDKRLEEPTRIKKPSQIFVSDMGDLFGDWVPDDWIRKVFDTINDCSQHIFLLLTKNPKRYREFEIPENAWIGTSAEDQAAADERIPELLQAEARVKFVSAEPLLGPVNIVPYIGYNAYRCRCGWHDTELNLNLQVYAGGKVVARCKTCEKFTEVYRALNLAIVGGQSGPNSHPMHPDWVRSLRDQCQISGTSFFFKQWGEWAEVSFNHPPHGKFGCWGGMWDSKKFNYGVGYNPNIYPRTINMQRIGKSKAGRLLDGRTWDELPEIGGQANA